MNPLVRRLSRAAVPLVLLAVAAAPALADVWPARPVTIVVSYPPGGDTDAIARAYAEKLSTRLGQTVLVDNRPGASGMIGNVYVAKAAADGYTLLFTPSTFPIAQHVIKAGPGVAHDVVKDFTPIVKTGNIPLVLVASPAVGIPDAKALIAQSKAGKTLTYGTPGAGSPMHIAGEMFNKEAGTSLTHVPYKGVAPMVNDTLGAHVSVGWSTPGVVAPHIAGGKLVALAVAEPKRTALMPQVPTLAELGYKDMEISAWMGLLGPRNLPDEVVRRLNAEMNEILKMPDIRQRMAALGIEGTGGEPKLLAQQIADDDRRFGRLVKEFGIRAD